MATKVVGYVSFDVKVECPQCKKYLYLNQYPYDEDGASDVGVSLFGSSKEPAKWNDLNIKIECCNKDCEEKLTLTKFEY